MELPTLSTTNDSHETDFDVEAQKFFEAPIGKHPHHHFSGRAPWLRAGVLGANDGDYSPTLRDRHETTLEACPQPQQKGRNSGAVCEGRMQRRAG